MNLFLTFFNKKCLYYNILKYSISIATYKLLQI
jgi:hypothetical protein